MSKVTEIFGTMVFDEAVMREKLPPEAYERMALTLKKGKRLDIETANIIASAMKDWAIELGATHFTHWFQPMTGVTAEKHDSFIAPSKDGKIIMDFTGKELVSGESDASSFPSGGLRATFEARGYTAWDPTSFAFVKDNTLYIPTAFCSFGGEALDGKTPLLRSMEAVNREALRILRLFGNDTVTAVKSTVGAEQEYFLIDTEMFDRRPDLIYTGRTLFGAKAPKGQELDDHYFGIIKPRVKEFMAELDEELWKVGVLSKTEHNEGAPCQHELAPIFGTTNIATDHNQLTMELMQKIAKKHGMVCILHEKPFSGVAGSGKHNNWSLSTDTGANLLEPGDTPFENAQFLLFLTAVIKAVDDYQELLRISVASAGNDHRLGASEAPPAVVSMFLGDEITAVLDAIENEGSVDAKDKEMMKIGVHVLPKFPKASSDRNRTSPFAFTGNKFEFRMLGASASIASANIVLNTAVAEVLKRFADELEGASDFNSALHNLIRRTVIAHKRILFNGNGYDDAWIAEAEARGLANLRTTPDALDRYLDEKNIKLFTENKVFSENEMKARHQIHMERYAKVLNIEARTMVGMVRGSILPAVAKYVRELSEAGIAARDFIGNAPLTFERETVALLTELSEKAYALMKALDSANIEAKALKCPRDRAHAYKNTVLPLMEELRVAVDSMERRVPAKDWPYPSYGNILFGVK
ncbi:MAG: glutamine synthetase type III [Ruminococcaceae bacterium]|nr:glutamine synthetase type III [Oscillospiraceae bacterium]